MWLQDINIKLFQKIFRRKAKIKEIKGGEEMKSSWAKNKRRRKKMTNLFGKEENE